MSPGRTAERHAMLQAVQEGRIRSNMLRGPWTAPTYKKRSGCYEWFDGVQLTLEQIAALINLRDADLIVTAPAAGEDCWPVQPTPAGVVTLTGWNSRTAVDPR